MQSPGRADEDTRGGFSHGGWAIPGNDEVMGRALGGRIGKPDGGLLLGRWSYEDMLTSWDEQGGPFKDAFKPRAEMGGLHQPNDEARVANSSLLHGDIPAAVGELETKPAR